MLIKSKFHYWLKKMKYKTVIDDCCRDIQENIVRWHDLYDHRSESDSEITNYMLNRILEEVESKKRFIDGICYVYDLDPPSSYYTPVPPRMEMED